MKTDNSVFIVFIPLTGKKSIMEIIRLWYLTSRRAAGFGDTPDLWGCWVQLCGVRMGQGSSVGLAAASPLQVAAPRPTHTAISGALRYVLQVTHKTHKNEQLSRHLRVSAWLSPPAPWKRFTLMFVIYQTKDTNHRALLLVPSRSDSANYLLVFPCSLPGFNLHLLCLENCCTAKLSKTPKDPFRSTRSVAKLHQRQNKMEKKKTKKLKNTTDWHKTNQRISLNLNPASKIEACNIIFICMQFAMLTV